VRKVDRAAEWVVSLLGDGPVDAAEVQRLAELEGISEATLRRATTRDVVDKRQVRDPDSGAQRWVWTLRVRVPESEQLRDEALALLAGLVIDGGRRWGDAAVDVQWEDAREVLDLASETPYHWLGRSRGYDKTAGVAGMAIAAMLTQAPRGARLFTLAADRDQGGLVVDSVSGYTARTPELGSALTVDHFKVTAPRVGATLEVLPADAASSYGLRPWLLSIDELSVWSDTDGPRRLLDGVTSALAKMPGARCVVITSAGDPGHFSHRVREHALADPLWAVHEVAGPPPWADAERLAEQKRRLLPSVYARLFENVWTAGEDRLTTLEDVRACVGHDGDLAYQSGHRYVASLDVGLTNDRTVSCVAHAEERAAGRVVVVDRLASWQGEKSRPVSLDAVESWVEEACRDYRCGLVFDKYQAAHLAQRLKGRRVRTEEFTFSTANIGRLAVTTYRLLRDHLFDLPDDAALIDELVNVQLREVGPGQFRIDHASNRHDDMAIALAMCAAHLVERPISTGCATSASGPPIPRRVPADTITTTYPWERAPWERVR
jgi:phage terminase large subunit-like protein